MLFVYLVIFECLFDLFNCVVMILEKFKIVFKGVCSLWFILVKNLFFVLLVFLVFCLVVKSVSLVW